VPGTIYLTLYILVSILELNLTPEVFHIKVNFFHVVKLWKIKNLKSNILNLLNNDNKRCLTLIIRYDDSYIYGYTL
jgi:hypothetical protein